MLVGRLSMDLNSDRSMRIILGLLRLSRATRKSMPSKDDQSCPLARNRRLMGKYI
jgi:hypothetical protein